MITITVLSLSQIVSLTSNNCKNLPQFYWHFKPLSPLGEKKVTIIFHVARYLKKYWDDQMLNSFLNTSFIILLNWLKPSCHLYPLISNPKFLSVHNLPLCCLHSFVHLSVLSLHRRLTFNNLRTLFKTIKYETNMSIPLKRCSV